MNSDIVNKRVAALRQWMKENNLDAFIFPSTDPHNGEYVPDHWKGREWISGFDGSAGTAVVTTTQAALWTDSRYFIAAEQQLAGTDFMLMRESIEGTPSIAEWLGTFQDKGTFRVGLDGMVCSADMVAELSSQLAKVGDFEVVDDLDPLGILWTGRPPIPRHPVELHPLEWAGETATAKIERIREQLRRERVHALMVTMLDDIAWTLNLRGTDVHCNPVFVSYLLIGLDDVVLFIDESKVSTEVADYLKGIGVSTQPYDEVLKWMGNHVPQSIFLDPCTVNNRLYNVIKNSKVIDGPSPIPTMKSVKNEVEIEGFRRAMQRDGVAMVKFLCWLEKAVEKGGETEMSIDRKLTSLRAEQPLFRGLSFDTIAGYAAHGAIVHYEATEATDAALRPEGLLLLDSGAQYSDGTTDITRTIALGPVSEWQKFVYTKVLQGHIRLQMLKFPDGACGSQLDAIARSPLWESGLNFLHGTGHGVGAYLNVHEGPHQIRQEWKPAPLHAGMTVTDEPGIYVAGEFGVRIENTLLIVPYMQTDFGQFLTFEPLTLCPIDTRPLLVSLLSDDERKWLNNYHEVVRERLAPDLEGEELAWLEQATQAI